MQRLLIIVEDKLGHDIVGPITLHKNSVTALRMWDDICRMEKSALSAHIADHQLVCVGYIDDESKDWKIVPDHQILITGEQWLASQQPREGN